MPTNLNNKRIVVSAAGPPHTGTVAVINWLLDNGAKVVISGLTDAERAEALRRRVDDHLKRVARDGKAYEKILARLSWEPKAPPTDIESLFLSLWKKKVIGIRGHHGKTTVAVWAAHLIGDAVAAGSSDKPLLSIVGSRARWAVIELHDGSPATSGLPVIDVDGRDNLDSAREAARLAGIPDKLITQRLKKLPRIPGRQEIVHQSQRLTVVNDSSAVGPTQTIYALGRWGGPNSILITGGQGSGDYSEWADCVRSNIRPANLVFLTGSATVKMRSALRDHARGVRAYDSLADAWRAARQRSGKYVKAVILFSPSAGEDELLDNGSNAGHRFNSLVKGEN